RLAVNDLAGNAGIAILGLALLLMMSKKNGAPEILPYISPISGRRLTRYVTEPAWRIPSIANSHGAVAAEGALDTPEEVEEAMNGNGKYPYTIIAPPRPAPKIVTYVSPITQRIVKRYVEEPAWRIPPLGLVKGAETLGRGAG
ncbi:unnamed protein product, partial [marine sediment metagenome]